LILLPWQNLKALSKLDAHVWHLAVEAKFTSLNKSKTWELTTLPQGRKTSSFKWVFKIKTKVDGTIDKYKVRLVA
jgi:predicted component of type VI protein secretion system